MNLLTTELRQKFINQSNQMDELKTIVNNIFLTDVNSENRQRQVVDARKVYSKILRDLGYSCQAIGDSIKKDHATILHYQKSIEHLLAYDDALRQKYKACKNAFLSDKQHLVVKTKKKDKDIYLTVIALEEKLERLIEERKKQLHTFVDFLENYEKESGHLPSISEYRNVILPLLDFDK